MVYKFVVAEETGHAMGNVGVHPILHGGRDSGLFQPGHEVSHSGSNELQFIASKMTCLLSISDHTDFAILAIK